MKNSITIQSDHAEILVAAQALRLKARFLEKGFIGKRAFIEIMCEIHPKYKNLGDISRMGNWWNGRVKDEGLNQDIEIVLNTL